MGLLLTALVAIGGLGAAVFLVIAQPRPVWDAAAEHSRRFWCVWAFASAVVGLAPAVASLWSPWVNAVWLAASCAFGALQPAMIADVYEVRRDISRRRQSTLAARRRSAGDDAAATVDVPKGG